MTIRVTEADLVNDLHALLAGVQEGIEVIVEQGSSNYRSYQIPEKTVP